MFIGPIYLFIYLRFTFSYPFVIGVLQRRNALLQQQYTSLLGEQAAGGGVCPSSRLCRMGIRNWPLERAGSYRCWDRAMEMQGSTRKLFEGLILIILISILSLAWHVLKGEILNCTECEKSTGGECQLCTQCNVTQFIIFSGQRGLCGTWGEEWASAGHPG